MRPLAAAIDEPAFKCLTIPAIRAPRGMNFVHTSRDYPLHELSNLLPGLWESSGLKALLWGAKVDFIQIQLHST